MQLPRNAINCMLEYTRKQGYGKLESQNKTHTPILASMNQKGGSGKTTIIGLLAEYFALVLGLRVLLIDLDMQCNTSDQWIGMETNPDAVGGQLPPVHPDYAPNIGVEERSSIADVFYAKPVLPYSSWLTEDVSGGGSVEVMCGHPKLLEDINLKFTSKDGSIDEKVLNRLKDFLLLEDLQSYYDIILLDTGPSRNPIFRAAMRAATHIVIPFKPEEKDIQGINAMLQIIRQENFGRPKQKLKLIGLLPNMVRKTSLHSANLKALAHKATLFPEKAWLHMLTAFPERDVKGIRPKSIFELPKSSPAYKQALEMALFVQGNLKLTKSMETA